MQMRQLERESLRNVQECLLLNGSLVATINGSPVADTPEQTSAELLLVSLWFMERGGDVTNSSIRIGSPQHMVKQRYMNW
jgi:hypothetical protein